MANFRDINGASRQLNRVTDIKLQEDNRIALESVMVALAAGGRVQEMAVIAQTLEKTSAETDLVGAIADLRQVIHGIKQPQAEVIPETKPEWVQELLTRVTALETK